MGEARPRELEHVLWRNLLRDLIEQVKDIKGREAVNRDSAAKFLLSTNGHDDSRKRAVADDLTMEIGS